MGRYIKMFETTEEIKEEDKTPEGQELLNLDPAQFKKVQDEVKKVKDNANKQVQQATQKAMTNIKSQMGERYIRVFDEEK